MQFGAHMLCANVISCHLILRHLKKRYDEIYGGCTYNVPFWQLSKVRLKKQVWGLHKDIETIAQHLTPSFEKFGQKNCKFLLILVNRPHLCLGNGSQKTPNNPKHDAWRKYQSIEIGAGFRIVNVGQPNILVTLPDIAGILPPSHWD